MEFGFKAKGTTCSSCPELCSVLILGEGVKSVVRCGSINSASNNYSSIFSGSCNTALDCHQSINNGTLNSTGIGVGAFSSIENGKLNSMSSYSVGEVSVDAEDTLNQTITINGDLSSLDAQNISFYYLSCAQDVNGVREINCLTNITYSCYDSLTYTTLFCGDLTTFGLNNPTRGCYTCNCIHPETIGSTACYNTNIIENGLFNNICYAWPVCEYTCTQSHSIFNGENNTALNICAIQCKNYNLSIFNGQNQILNTAYDLSMCSVNSFILNGSNSAYNYTAYCNVCTMINGFDSKNQKNGFCNRLNINPGFSFGFVYPNLIHNGSFNTISCYSNIPLYYDFILNGYQNNIGANSGCPITESIIVNGCCNDNGLSSHFLLYNGCFNRVSPSCASPYNVCMGGVLLNGQNNLIQRNQIIAANSRDTTFINGSRNQICICPNSTCWMSNTCNAFVLNGTQHCSVFSNESMSIFGGAGHYSGAATQLSYSSNTTFDYTSQGMSTLLSACCNLLCVSFTSVGGGIINRPGTRYSSIVGGKKNQMIPITSGINKGYCNFITGGLSNSISRGMMTIGGGQSNNIYSTLGLTGITNNGTILGGIGANTQAGTFNNALGCFTTFPIVSTFLASRSTQIGGFQNRVLCGPNNVIIGGISNNIGTNVCNSVIFGAENNSPATSSVIISGSSNSNAAASTNSLIISGTSFSTRMANQAIVTGTGNGTFVCGGNVASLATLCPIIPTGFTSANIAIFTGRNNPICAPNSFTGSGLYNRNTCATNSAVFTGVSNCLTQCGLVPLATSCNNLMATGCNNMLSRNCFNFNCSGISVAISDSALLNGLCNFASVNSSLLTGGICNTFTYPGDYANGRIEGIGSNAIGTWNGATKCLVISQRCLPFGCGESSGYSFRAGGILNISGNSFASGILAGMCNITTQSAYYQPFIVAGCCIRHDTLDENSYNVFASGVTLSTHSNYYGYADNNLLVNDISVMNMQNETCALSCGELYYDSTTCKVKYKPFL